MTTDRTDLHGGGDVLAELRAKVLASVPLVGATLPDDYRFTLTVHVTAAELRALSAPSPDSAVTGLRKAVRALRDIAHRPGWPLDPDVAFIEVQSHARKTLRALAASRGDTQAGPLREHVEKVCADLVAEIARVEQMDGEPEDRNEGWSDGYVEGVAYAFARLRIMLGDATPTDSPQVGTEAPDVCVMKLCETEALILKPDLLYRFEVDPNCERCRTLHEVGAVFGSPTDSGTALQPDTPTPERADLAGWWAVNPRGDKLDLGPRRGPAVYCESETLARTIAGKMWPDTAEVTPVAAPSDSAVTGLRELRRIVNARLQTKAINRDRAQAAGRETVAQCRQSDVDTLEWVLSEIDQIGARAAATRETRMEAQP